MAKHEMIDFFLRSANGFVAYLRQISFTSSGSGVVSSFAGQ